MSIYILNLGHLEKGQVIMWFEQPLLVVDSCSIKEARGYIIKMRNLNNLRSQESKDWFQLGLAIRN